MMVLLTSDAFVAGHGRAPASRVRTAQVLMRELFFSELDERRAVAFLQQWPKRRFRDGVNTWGSAEWQLFGLPSQLEFTSEPLPNGVRFAYYLSEEGRRRAGREQSRLRAHHLAAACPRLHQAEPRPRFRDGAWRLPMP